MDVEVKKHIEYDAAEDKGTITYLSGPRGVEPGTTIFAMFPPTVIQFQHGPIQDNGYNGIQNEDALNLILVRLRALNAAFPCRENALAITNIEQGLMWLERRTAIRKEQGVEGKNLAHQS